jgi:2-polyprenyl-3-methyl-5-hydroxy-6-metoxy-1,4-benzoquinol methylase
MQWALDPEGRETNALHRLVNFDYQDVVEIGAGDGRLTQRYADRAASVLALDTSESEVRRAQLNVPPAQRNRVSFQTTDITVEALPKNAFDIAVLSWVIC